MVEYAPYLPALGFLLGVLCIAAGFRAGRRRRLIDSLPTSTSSSVFIGFVALKGSAESANPLASYLSERACVNYTWAVDESWSRTVTETYQDEKGNSQTRTRQESGWTTVAHGGEGIAFFLKDDSGYLLIRPDGAKVEPEVLLDETCGRGSPLYYAKGPTGAVANSDFKRRFVERGIPVHTRLYIVGQAKEREDIVAPEIASDPAAPMYLISTHSEEQVSSGMKWSGRAWNIAGLAILLGSVFGRGELLGIPPGDDWVMYVVLGIAYCIVCALAWVWMTYNSLIDLRQRVRQAWSLVDIQLKRRNDLIPNLVQAVQGFQDHEAQLQTELSQMRSQLAATQPGQAGPDYSAIGRTCTVISERYPELKANDLFLSLQKNLSDTEQRIALARNYFNDIATNFNTRLAVIPDKFIAALAGMTHSTLMTAGDFERAPVELKLTTS